MRSKKLTNKKQKISLKNIKDLGMACHIPPLKKAKKQGEIPLPSVGPIPSHFFNGMGLRLGNGIFPCFFAFIEGWNMMTGHP